MKYIEDPDIDLTTGRDFAKRSSRTVIDRWMDVVVHRDNFIPSDYLFPTGYAEEIRERMRFKELYEYSCDRCGTKLVPWQSTKLCPRCEEELQEQVSGNLPWRRDNQIRLTPNEDFTTFSITLTEEDL